VIGKQKDEHKPERHLYKRDESLPLWQGFHGFRRGAASTLHGAGVPDKTIQSVLRHANLSVTMNSYVKTVEENQVNAMNLLGQELEKDLKCTNHAPKAERSIH
jgi:integrase